MSFVQAVQVPISAAVADDSGSKLRQAAQDFESVLLGTLLEKMEQAVEDESSDSADCDMKSLGVEYLAKAWAQRGGIGIAKMIMPYLEKQATAPDGPSELKLPPKLPMIGKGGVGTETAR